jgi:hypothetical protein
MLHQTNGGDMAQGVDIIHEHECDQVGASCSAVNVCLRQVFQPCQNICMEWRSGKGDNWKKGVCLRCKLKFPKLRVHTVAERFFASAASIALSS